MFGWYTVGRKLILRGKMWPKIFWTKINIVGGNVFGRNAFG